MPPPQERRYIYEHISEIKSAEINNLYFQSGPNFDAGLSECCHHENISLLAYSPIAMGLLSGKYLSENGGPSNARLNLFKGRYSEGESRYRLSKPEVKFPIQVQTNPETT